MTCNFYESVYGVTLGFPVGITEFINDQGDALLPQITLRKPRHALLSHIQRKRSIVLKISFRQFLHHIEKVAYDLSQAVFEVSLV